MLQSLVMVREVHHHINRLFKLKGRKKINPRIDCGTHSHYPTTHFPICSPI
jgi:hypothetical protein